MTLKSNGQFLCTQGLILGHERLCILINFRIFLHTFGIKGCLTESELTFSAVYFTTFNGSYVIVSRFVDLLFLSILIIICSMFPFYIFIE